MEYAYSRAVTELDGKIGQEGSVHYGVSMPNFGGGVDARAIAVLALEAEDAGWGGFFLWDHLLAFSPGLVPVVDPWIALTAAALSTSSIRLGPMVTPLPRRRPVKLARETASLDRLSGGRLTLGVGIGAMPYEYDYLGEEPNALPSHRHVYARSSAKSCIA